MSLDSETNTSSTEASTTEATTTAAPAATTSSTTEPLIGGKPAATEWAEYTPDPNKTPDENAAAKADHDKTKPQAETKTEPAKVEPLTIDDIKFPEGVTIDKDDPLMQEYLGTLNDSQLSLKDRAQKLIDLQIKASTQASERASSAWAKLQEDRKDEWSKDPTVGGATQSKIAADGNKLLAQFGSSELAELIGESGVGNSVHFARFVHKIAPFLLEGKPVVPNTAVNQGGYTPVNLYPEQDKK